MKHMGGTGIFTAVMCAFFAVELYRFMKKHNITIRMPEQVPPAIARSFEVLLPVLAVFLTLYPLSIFVQTQYDMLIPDAVMAMFKPLISASNTLPAIIGALLVCQLLWFAGIHGAAIVVGLLSPIFLTNISLPTLMRLSRVNQFQTYSLNHSGISTSLLVVRAQRLPLLC